MSRFAPYLRLMRLHQPVGIWLLLWPCLWSIALASAGHPPLLLLIIYTLGAVVMRAAGCIINDIWDRKFDAQVERTKNRPLASGELSVSQALGLLVVLLCIALLLAMQLGTPTVIYACASLPLVALYPLMKRITWWPQLFLGLTFNWGALLGWVSVHGSIEAPAIALYAGCIFWTLGYDTIYAHQDIADDQRIGVKSTARRLGSNTKNFVALCYVIFAAIFAYALHSASLLSAVSIFFIASWLCAVWWNLFRLALDTPNACKRAFSLHAKAGFLLFIAILVS